MRALAVVVLVGCAGNGDESAERCGNKTCQPGELCTRTDECVAASEVRAIHVSWTLGGQPGNATTCTGKPDLSALIFSSLDRGHLMYSPVPCAAGMFSVDRLAIWFDLVQLGALNDAGRQGGKLDSAGNLTLDLPW